MVPSRPLRATTTSGEAEVGKRSQVLDSTTRREGTDAPTHADRNADAHVAATQALGGGHRSRRLALVALLAVLGLGVGVLGAAQALAISAPIQITNTGGEGVYIRSEPNTSSTRLGWMPEGASPDYQCFAYGQNINGVPVWFNVTYNGVTGYYASYYDNSSYHSNAELTAKYGIPLCGSTPPTEPPSTPGGGGSPGTPGGPAPTGSTFPVMNGSGGIYWRSEPNWAAPEAEPGNGVYEGTAVTVHCYQSGTSVPGSADTMWELASWATGPGRGEGWLNEHFINDGAPINQAPPGVPACNVPAPATTPTPPSTPVILASATTQALPPDPDLWCANSDIHRYDTQIREADWIVLFKGVVGTPGKNNWRCAYLVSMQGPGNELGNFTLPIPVTMTSPVDFRAACAEQFPGSRLEWTGTGAYPWRCVGVAGRYYPPPGIHLSAVVMRGGFTTGGLPATGPGSLQVTVTAGAASRTASVASATAARHASRGMVLARGARRVGKRGRYSLRVALTPAGRRALTQAHQLSAVVTARFAARTGRPTVLVGRLTLR